MNRKQIFHFLRWSYDHLTHVNVYNADLLPDSGPFILALNHNSRLDFPLLLYSDKRSDDLKALVADKYKKYPAFKYIVEHTEMIWIDRSTADFGAFRKAFEWIHQGKILCLAPEGTRSRNGQLLEGKSGVVFLASKSGVPICTASISGTDKGAEDLKHFRKPNFTIRFGPPFLPEKIDPDHREESLHVITDQVMCRIAAMLPASYRGYYKDNPLVAQISEQWKKDPSINLPDD